MDINTLLEITKTRIIAEGNNPTSTSFLYEIYKSLEELKVLREEKMRSEQKGVK